MVIDPLRDNTKFNHVNDEAHLTIRNLAFQDARSYTVGLSENPDEITASARLLVIGRFQDTVQILASSFTDLISAFHSIYLKIKTDSAVKVEVQGTKIFILCNGSSL